MSEGSITNHEQKCKLHICSYLRYIQVEVAFFYRWWADQNEATRQIARDLVSSGRLELSGGGWSMNDDAATHYSSIVDNMALGFDELKKLFGMLSL